MIRFVKPPFDPPKPNDLAGQLAEAIRIAAADLASKKETELGHVVTGCDGYPVVTIGDGTTCHDGAKAANGGGLALTANLGGSRAVINANLGRSQSMNSGYQGTGLSSGAIPPAMDAGAADVSLNPIDTSTNLAINAGDSADPLADFIGATISGKTGDSKRLAVCYGTGGAGVWDDILTGTETAITGLSINPHYIAAMGADKYALTRLYSATVSLTDAGAEASTTALPAFTGATDYAFSAVAFTRDLDTMAVLAPQNGSSQFAVYIGTSMLTAPSWATLNLGTTYDFQVYGVRALAFDANGNLFIAAQLSATLNPAILMIAAPYAAITTVLTPSWTSGGGAGQWNDPSPLAISRDGRYMAAGAHSATAVADIWEMTLRTRIRTLAPTGYTLPVNTGVEQGYGGMAFGPDGRLFILLRKTADGTYHLGVWTPPFAAAAEIIDLSMAAPPLLLDWVSVSGDGQVVAVSSNVDGDIILVEPPYTAGGATVTPKTLSGTIEYQFEFDPSEAYADASGLTLACTVQSTTGSGSAVTVVTRLTYANTSGVAAFGVVIEMTLPDGSTFTSATDDGIYDSEAGIVRWLIPSVAASGTGYVEITSSVG